LELPRAGITLPHANHGKSVAEASIFRAAHVIKGERSKGSAKGSGQLVSAAETPAASPPPQAPVGIDDGGTGRGGGAAENMPPAPAAPASTAGTPSSAVSLIELVRLIKTSMGMAIEKPMAPAVNEAVGDLGLTCDGMSLKEKANAVAQELGLVERA